MRQKRIPLFDGLPPYISRNGVVSSLFDCGPGLADDRLSPTSENSFLYLITETDEKEFDDFLKVASDDRDEVTTNEAGKYCSFRANGSLFYAYYTYAEHAARIIWDASSNGTLSSLTYGEAGGRIELFQYSLNYVDASVTYAEDGAMDCGMLYVFRFPDGSLFLIDSAHGNQTTQRFLDGLYRFLRKISGVREGEKIPIRGWFFTHAHGDHTGMAAAFLGETYPGIAEKKLQSKYADQLDIQSVLFNFPSYQISKSGYAADESMAMKAAFRKNYPNILCVKLHTGQSFSLFGMRFEVLYTFEDSVTPAGEWGLTEFNSSSTVIKMTYGRNALLFLADINRRAEGIILERYTTQTLACNVVQIAHHCINDLSIYDTIRAKYALVPTSYGQMVGRHIKQYSRFCGYAVQGCFCADACTWKLQMDTDSIQTEALERYDACELPEKERERA